MERMPDEDRIDFMLKTMEEKKVDDKSKAFKTTPASD